MTLAQIMTLALRQLDEDPEDLSEYDDVFRAYAAEGYAIAMREYVRPRAFRSLYADGRGIACLEGQDIRRVISAADGEGRSVCFALLPDGRHIRVNARDAEITALCEIDAPPLMDDTDEPRMSEHVHAALADYICYRHLSSGNLAKQSRAQFYYRSFLEQMGRLRAQGFGSVTSFSGLYEVTGLR